MTTFPATDVRRSHFSKTGDHAGHAARFCPRYYERCARAEDRLGAAFRFENDDAPHLICDANYWLFGDLPEDVPANYFDENPSTMIAYQTAKIERHVQEYDDCYIPFLMPWYGTGVLASGFGVPVKFLDKNDPAVEMATPRGVGQLKDIAKPNPDRDGLMPRVLNTIREMRHRSDLPVGVTDCQGPLTTALQIVGYDNLIYWMYDHSDAVHGLMQQITEALIDWVRVQKQLAGQSPTDDAYVIGVKIPAGFGGVWISDDDSIIFSKDLYREFVVPYNSQVLQAFGGGAIHYCGNANQHIANYLATEGLHAIHNLNLDDLDGAARMRHALAEKKIAYIASDLNVGDARIDGYYEQLFAKLGRRGLIVVTSIAPTFMLAHGKYTLTRRDPLKTGRLIEQAIQKYNHA